MSFETTAISFLEASLVRPLAIAALAWMGLRVFRVRHPAVEHAVWTGVLACLVLAPVATVAPRLSLHVLPPSNVHSASSPAVAPYNPVPGSGPETPPTIRAATPPAAGTTNRETALLAIYVAGFAAALAYQVMGWWMLQGLVARSRRTRAFVRESGEIASPVAVGVWQRCVILPAGWREWTLEERRAVLTHEFAHLRRGDGWVMALVRIAQAIFWFHPLSWWVGRRIAECAELACDFAAIGRTRDQAAYSRLLLGFAEAVRRSRTGLSMPGLAMASASSIGRRIDRILQMGDVTVSRRVLRGAAALALSAAPIVCVAAAMNLSEQQPQPTLARPVPKLEVVSIKPCTDADLNAMAAQGGRGGGRGRINASPGRLSYECTTVDNLIRTAYLQYPDGQPEPIDANSGLRMQRASRRMMTQEFNGAPGWLKNDRYTIDATAEGAPAREMMLGPMMQSVLEGRFALKVRTEKRDNPVYALMVAKSGPKLAPATHPCKKEDFTQPPASPGPERLMICGAVWRNFSGEGGAYGVTMSGLLLELDRVLDLDVIDRTGLTGRYDIEFNLSPADATRGLAFGDPQRQAQAEAARAAATDPPGTSVYAALNKLGLRVDQVKVPAEFLVIDHIEKPTAN